MKPERVFLDELNANSKAYKVKVKVIEKGRAKTSPQKKVVFQNLLLQDDKGNRMKGTLFGDQVEGYNDAFVYNGNYEIANAPIKPCQSQWKTSPNDLDYQMSFGRQTIIQPIDTESGPILPEYQTIAQIPKVVNEEEKFDVLGVVIYIEEKPRKVVTGQGRELLVREIVIVDHRVQQPMLISAWNDLAENDCETLNTWSEKFPVFGFTALRVSSYKGLSLTTNMSTTFIQSPKGIRASNLEEWALRHQDVLADMQARVLDVRTVKTERVVKTIEALRKKRVHLDITNTHLQNILRLQINTYMYQRLTSTGSKYIARRASLAKSSHSRPRNR